MDNSLKFKEFREKYKVLNYNSYSINENDKEIYIQFEFEIPGLTTFHPTLKILKKKFNFKDINTPIAQNMVFNIGLIELISYWKCACPKIINIKCGKLSEEQIKFWKKIYYYGLGELFYRNNINVKIDDFVSIKSEGKEINIEKQSNDNNSGIIIPVGGGKDSCVTMETLNIDTNTDLTLIINPKEVTLKCAQIRGFKNDNIIEIYRTIDKNLIDLNSKGFINGHTPFSAMLAFVSYFVAYLTGKKYIALSNESSANESNVLGEKINHQYSKSFEFECDFEEYSNKYLKTDIKYFSFLRPLNELQIASIFSKYEKYHSTFKSCNVGSKEKTWIWCGKCAKCLFAYIILSPFLYKEKLVNIFGKDMFEDESLLHTFLELTGDIDVKPFDCVGTFEEVNYAISLTIKNLEKQDKELPYLLKYYKRNCNLVDIDNTENILLRYNEENNLTDEQNHYLRKEVFNS